MDKMNHKTIQDKLKQNTPSIIGQDNLKRYSLLLPLIEKEDGMHLLFEVRSLNMRRQPGEICFPGGKMDEEDAHPQETAVREATEELGVQSKRIKDVYSFGYMVSPFGMKIDAYVGLLDCNETELIPNQAEVAEVFTVPLEFFLETEPDVHYIQLDVRPEDDFPYHSIPNGENYKWSNRRYKEYFYHYGDHVIWGLTAHILHDFIKAVQ